MADGTQKEQAGCEISERALEGLCALLQARKKNCKMKYDLDKQMVIFGYMQSDSEM